MIVIGISGGSGSGKTCFCDKLSKKIGKDKVIIISQDSYYKDNSNISRIERRKINFDHPNSIDFRLLFSHITDLKENRSIYKPVYSFRSSTRLSKKTKILPNDIILIEGILIFTDKNILELLDLKIYIDVDEKNRLKRIIDRDIKERSRNEEVVIRRFYDVVQPMHNQFVESTKNCADLIIPMDYENTNVLDIISNYIKNKS